jgi:thiol-disulfide isomerase/thioredoxin
MVTVKKFSAVWCGPCRALAPVVNEIKGQFSNVKFEDYDVDTDYDAATQYGIRSVPTVVIEKDGVELTRTFHRHAKHPGEDVSNEDPKVQAIANAIWTEEVIAAYQALIANNTL